MATFVPYEYVPTASRPRGAKGRRRPTPEQSSILNDHAPAKQMGVALDALLPAVGAASNDNGSGMPGDQVETSIAYFDNFGDYDDHYLYLPTIEELLHNNLHKAGSGVEEADKEHIRGAVEECLEEARSIDQNTSALSVSFSGDQGNPIELRDDELCTSEDEIDRGNVNGDQEILSRTEIVLNPILTPTSDPDQESSILDSMRPSSEPLHDRINTEDPFMACAESETTKSLSAHHRSQSPRRPRSSQQNLLGQEVLVYPRQAKPALDNNTISEEKLLQQQDDEEKINSNYDRLRQSNENTAMVTPMTETGDELHFPARVIRRTSLAKRPRILPSRSPSLEPNEDGATSNSDNCSGDELSSTEVESDEGDRRSCPTKRKWPSSSNVGPTQRKRGRLQLESTQQGRNCSPHRHRWRPHSHGSRVAPACGGNSQLPSPPRSALEAMDTETSSDCGTLSESSKHIQPLLIEVTFRPHSPNYYSFSAFIQDDRDEPEFSFSQFSKLIDCVGHAGNIEDLTIKPMTQHLFLVTGFSRHTSFRPSQSGRTVGSTTNACRVPLGARRTRLDKRGSASAFPSQRREMSSSVVDDGYGDGDFNPDSDDDVCSSEDELGRDMRKYRQWSPSSSVDDNGFGDGELNPGSNNDACLSDGDVGYSSEDDVGRSVKYSRWSPLEKQRLAAYKKEDKPLKWIFSKFPGRTEGAVRTRWSTMQPRV